MVSASLYYIFILIVYPRESYLIASGLFASRSTSTYFPAYLIADLLRLESTSSISSSSSASLARENVEDLCV